MAKIDVRVKRTYNLLTEALISLLKEKSFDDLTVLEICDEASVHRATFYKHFVDKYDFLHACLRNKFSQLIFDKPADKYTSETMKKSCMNMLLRVLGFIENNDELIVRVSDERYSATMHTALIDAIADFIDERIKTLKPISEKISKNIPMISSYYAGAVVGIIKWWISSEKECTKQELLDFAELRINDLSNYFDLFI